MEAPVIIAEEKDLIAVAKPAGMLVHAAHARPRVAGKKPAAAEPTLAEWLAERYPELRAVGDDPVARPGIVHRLDKDTSGIMIVPRTQEYFAYLKSLFAERKVVKAYLALVWGAAPEKGSVDLAIGLKAGTTRRTVHGGKMVKEAHTDFTLLEHLPTTSLVEVRPRTGRTHQIRVHLASIGHPLVGDPLYGKKKGDAPWAARLMLHARSLSFEAAAGEWREFEAPTGKDWEEVVHSAAHAGDGQ